MQVKNENKYLTDAKILHQWLETVPRGQYGAVKEELQKECLVSKAILNNWIYGNCRITDAGKRDINRVTLRVSGVEIFNLATVE
jgi:hypothetical protein